jgi:hypothetical protein
MLRGAVLRDQCDGNSEFQIHIHMDTKMYEFCQNIMQMSQNYDGIQNQPVSSITKQRTLCSQNITEVCPPLPKVL